MSFKSDMNKAKAKIQTALEKTIRGAALDLFRAIVLSTPVGQPSEWQSTPPKGYIGGRLRGNWQANLAAPKIDQLNLEDAAGGATIGAANSNMARYDLKDTIYFTNNLPYAERVENGWSRQAPQGMMKTNVKKFKPTIENLARKFKV